ncbi:cobalamin biosynthesis protein CobG [Pseudaestuariivita sp.]|uniref:cobalamin biosynthesis protein CobG n=1 Tax=Pseudaestuariivita sp. TaxID=2211669 RepID=UPI00405A0A29
MSAEVQVKGWCPTALRPMASGDGLLVRVAPPMSRATAEQAAALGEAALDHGSGWIDLTSRANLQIRGVTGESYPPLLAALQSSRLAPQSEGEEFGGRITLTPLRQADDESEALFHALIAHAAQMPVLPDKMGVVIDTGPSLQLRGMSADFRFEQSDVGLILRADGSDFGRPVTVASAADALAQMAQWFLDTRAPDIRRMAPHLKTTPLPDAWTNAPAQHDHGARLLPGFVPGGRVIGLPFGKLRAEDLIRLDCAIRVLPGRLLFLEDRGASLPQDAITAPGDPRLRHHACPGAPACTSAEVETLPLARALTSRQHIHVSGCAKGCAHPRPATLTFVGRDGRFDLVRGGTARETPERTGLSPQDARRIA